MRWTRVVGWGSSLVLVASLALTLSCGDRRPPMTQGQAILHGEYLAWIAGCVDCHTPGGIYGAPDTTRLMAGTEVGWQGPWGVTYAPNLTPDEETGIGGWSRREIIAAIRTGHRPDSSPLLPPMPWRTYARLTDDDANALVSYLRSIKPILHQSPAFAPVGSAPTGPKIALPPPGDWDAPKTAADGK